jgi:hypothetical protein
VSRDHFALAEKLLADTAELDPTLPFVIHKVARAGVHAQLATVQAFTDSCECDYPLPWRQQVTVETKGDLL